MGAQAGQACGVQRFPREGNGSAFPIRAGEVESLIGTPYVITNDADTILPPGAAHRLLGALLHPLNRAEFDHGGRLKEGYTFIQPRVEIAPQAGMRSLFSRLYTGDTAIDIYSRAVSDVYQDLFGEGIFIGKGAYDVAAFRRCLEGRVPENTILSHDLFEGCTGARRWPATSSSTRIFRRTTWAMRARSHRWIRGDWQILPWLFAKVPGADGSACPAGSSARPLEELPTTFAGA